MAEALYLLRSLQPAQEKILEWIADGVLVCPFVPAEEVAQVRGLWKKYADVPMSLADACLVRFYEAFEALPKICSQRSASESCEKAADFGATLAA